MSSRFTTLFGITLLSCFVLVASPGCKKPPAPVAPPAPEVRLQVASVSPGAVAPEQTAAVRVYGSAFEPGASVSFGGTGASEVRVSDSNTIEVTVPPMALGSYDVVVSNPGGESATLRSGLTVKVLELSCRSATIGFGFDLHALDGSARSTLDGHMACYQGSTGTIRVEGHADERGTVDYNMALGQRRADTVKQHLVSGGVSSSRVSAVSLGEERPAASGHNESAWSQNRRAEVSVTE